MAGEPALVLPVQVFGHLEMNQFWQTRRHSGLRAGMTSSSLSCHDEDHDGSNY